MDTKQTPVRLQDFILTLAAKLKLNITKAKVGKKLVDFISTLLLVLYQVMMEGSHYIID